MEHHKNLYKNNISVMNSRQIRREEQAASRSKKRGDLFANSRNFESTKSPLGTKENDPDSTPLQLQSFAENIENIPQQVMLESVGDKSYTYNIATPAAVANSKKKVTRAEGYIRRYIEWKESKKEQKTTELTSKKRPPFVPVVKSGPIGTSHIKTGSFAPANHKFHAPTGLKKPTVAPMPTNEKTKKRTSIYVVKTTPPKKDLTQKNTKQPIYQRVPISHLAMQPKHTLNDRSTSTIKPNSSVATKQIIKKSIDPHISNAATTSRTMTKSTSSTATKTHSSTASKTHGVTASKILSGTDIKTNSSVIKTTADAMTKTIIRNTNKTTVNSARTNIKTTAGTANLVTNTTATKGISSTGTKSNSTAIKTTNSTYPKTTSSDKINIHKPGSLHQRNRNGINTVKQQFPIVRKALAPVQPTRPTRDFAIPAAVAVTKKITAPPNRGAVAKARAKLQTSTDEKKLRPKLATSMKAKRPNISITAASSAIKVTKTKKPNAKLLLLKPPSDSLSAPAETPIGHSNLVFVTSTQMRTQSRNNSLSTKEFNGLNSSISPVENNIKNNVNKNNDNQTSVELQHHSFAKRALMPSKNVQTPTKLERKFNFLRVDANITLTPTIIGKPHIENELTDDETLCVEPKALIAQLPPAAQRTLQAVAHFRQELAAQIARLHALCDEWEAYKVANIEKLQETDGEDMIDATIGQTKLLTSKKFMQFKGLIDRCELGAKGEAPIDDGSEDTKLITAIDLDGFWSMLDLQVCKLNERFTELERWRENNWTDPVQLVEQAKKKKAKKPTTKPIKNNVAAKAKPSSGLQQMLRRLHAEKLKLKTGDCDGGDSSDDKPNSSSFVSNTPKRLSNLHRSRMGDTPASQRRISIVVRDRKSRSIAPTVISIPTPLRYRRSHMGQQLSLLDDNEPKISPAIKKLNHSISQLREVCKIEAQSNSNDNNDDSTRDSGTYSLRNRKVVLRPSSEIIVPRR